MSPTLQASDLDVDGVDYAARLAEANGGRPVIHKSDGTVFITRDTATDAMRALAQSLSAQLAAEKARADKAEERIDELLSGEGYVYFSEGPRGRIGSLIARRRLWKGGPS